MLVELLLFIALQPGLLLAIPRVPKGRTSIATILVHAAVFYVLLSVKSYIPILNKLEGFQTTTVDSTEVETDPEVSAQRDTLKTAREALKAKQQAELADLLAQHKAQREALRASQTTALKQTIAKKWHSKHPEKTIPTDASGNPVVD
jgi:hypothetical protein